MNTLFEINEPDSRIIVVENKYTAEQLIPLLENFIQYTDSYAKIETEKRKKEFLIPRILVNRALDSPYIVNYNSEGKPLLNTKMHLSISHSKDFYGIIVSSTHQVGIDLEYNHQRYEHIKDKYISEKEVNTLDYLPNLDIIWSAKESIFKIFGGKVVDFRRSIQIDKIDDKELLATALGEKLNVLYHRFDSFCLSYCKHLTPVDFNTKSSLK